MRDETSERFLQAIDYKEKEELNKKIAGVSGNLQCRKIGK